MQPPEDAHILHVESTFDPQTNYPLVLWQYRGHKGVCTLQFATDRAIAILKAVAMAENEAAVVRYLMGIEGQNAKGFQPKQQASKMEAQFLMLLRTARTPLPEGLTPIFGHSSQISLIEIDWYGVKIQFDCPEATQHAMQLLSCVEAAETDAFLRYFVQRRLGCTASDGQQFIEDFRKFRNVQSLNSLLEI
jgi:hypothetical protein